MRKTPAMSIPSYITIPQAASPIDGPGRKSSSRPVPPPPRARLPSFPPASSTVPPPPRKFSVPSTSSLSTNVSDMLLSSLLPPNLPKIPQAKTAGGPGRPRELSSQRESLSLPLMSNNFRRFITKVAPNVTTTWVDAVLTAYVGRTGVLAAGSFRRSLVLAETKVDMDIPPLLDLYMWVHDSLHVYR